ncbi:MAG: glycosyltransferase [Xanthobacteraceae bacterium]
MQADLQRGRRTREKIVHLTSAHIRSDGRIFEKECRSLLSAGYDVELVVADGLGNGCLQGVAVHDVGRPKSRVARMTTTQFAIYRCAMRIDADLYHFHDPELIFVGCMLKAKGKLVIFDAHEMVAEQIKHRTYIPKMFRTSMALMYQVIESRLAKRFDAVVVPQEIMTDIYKKMKRTVVVENFAIAPDGEAAYRKKDFSRLVIFHAGTNNKDRGLINICRLAAALPLGDKLILAGKIDGSELNDARREPGWERIDYKGIMNYNDVSFSYRNSNVGIVLYNNIDQYRLSFAVKLFEYMSYGIPVVMPDFGEWVKFNSENNCGVCVNVTDSAEILSVLEDWRRHPERADTLGQNGLRAFQEKYEWRVAERKLLNLYAELLKNERL